MGPHNQGALFSLCSVLHRCLSSRREHMLTLLHSSLLHLINLSAHRMVRKCSPGLQDRKRSASAAGLSSGHGHSGSEGHFTHGGEVVHTGRISSPLPRDRRGRGCFRTNSRRNLPELAKQSVQISRSQHVTGNDMDAMSSNEECGCDAPEFTWEPCAAFLSPAPHVTQPQQSWHEPISGPSQFPDPHCGSPGHLLSALLSKEESADLLSSHHTRHSYRVQSQSMPTIEEEDPHQHSFQAGSWQLVSDLQGLRIQEQ